ncbi:MAG: ABC transporter permease [Chloroherpetonaceae bacterium]|nr:ABC transporter permease [Chthonomonadaceae bacterium]MDW8207039.1 ABC transporter permease [Chloroherpetonaceae bacterium]
MTGAVTPGSGLARALLSVGIALVVAAVIMHLSGYDALSGLAALWAGATGLRAGPPQADGQIAFGAGPFTGHLDVYNLAQSLARSTPLLFTGLSVALGLRAGLFNIGAQGQMIAGALAAAVIGGAGGGTLPGPVHLLLVLCAGALAGAAWGAVPGILRATRGVHEVISTILFNYLATNLATYLVTHGLKDPDPRKMAPQTAAIAPTAHLHPWVAGSNLTAGLLLALVAAMGVACLVRRTSAGFQIRAVGQGLEAARAAGISVPGVMVRAMALAGALAGVAGAIEVMGVHHRYVQGLAGTYGFDGIAVALLGGLNGMGVTLSALFFGALSNGAEFMELETNVPRALAVIVQAIVILCVGVRLARRSLARQVVAAVQDSDEDLLEEEHAGR